MARTVAAIRGRQRIVPARRQYNQWVADETMEDYALRFTARSARRSPFQVANTALGAISFLACEAIGGSLTLAYGFENTAFAILLACVVMFLVGLPICYYGARYGVDIDLLARGAGFGYLGSTITSLIYAFFTFLLFAFEASIMAAGLTRGFGLPPLLADFVSVACVVPLAAFGIRLISRLQLATQPIWLFLQFVPLGLLVLRDGSAPLFAPHAGGVDIMTVGIAASLLLSLLPQIGEQVDYLRFLPELRKEGGNRWRWWAAMITAGPGWVVIGGAKLLAGALLATLAIHHGVPADQAAIPAVIYGVAFGTLLHAPVLGIALAGAFVALCQVKINVTNAYAGSIAWSNFFSRLTHAHPGRVVWLAFNGVLALLLMEIGVFHALTALLGLYANFAVAWIGALTADLVINKPLGLSPRGIEFKRAHLFDINPVGVGALAISVIVSSLLALGVMGPTARAFATFAGLLTAFAAAPAIAWATRGRTYIARAATPFDNGRLVCSVCENRFDGPDMAHCPAYGGPICSLCCTLDVRCHDQCKPGQRLSDQAERVFTRLHLPILSRATRSSIWGFLGVFLLFTTAISCLLALIYALSSTAMPAQRAAVRTVLWAVFVSLLIVSGVASWILVLAVDSRTRAEQEAARQSDILMGEIEAHDRTDAALQKAKDVAEAANLAKSRYIVGLSHEMRTPLNAILGYAQLMERDPRLATPDAVRVIRRSGDHLANLVDGLMEISRVESGTLTLSRDRIRLAPFLDQVVDMFRVQAADRGIALLYECPPSLPGFVYSDEKRLRQILLNLLSNAIKYTEDGSVTLRVSWRNQIADLIVQDTGIGIRPEDMERIFEPFERGGMARARAIPGTGLGLTIAKLLTEIMGGRMTVRSTQGQGSVFEVRLMLLEAMETAATETDQLRPPVGYAGPRRTILLVDDNDAHLALMQQLLRPLGFVLFTACDGETAISLARSIRPDLAILDISMPGADGWEVARFLRGHYGADIRILMLSAHVQAFRVSDPEAGPHDAVLGKPVDIDQVLAVTAALLHLHWLYETPTESTTPHALPPGFTAHIPELLQLGRIGYVRGIERRLDEIVAARTDHADYATSLKTLVQGFRLREFMETLKEADDDV